VIIQVLPKGTLSELLVRIPGELRIAGPRLALALRVLYNLGEYVGFLYAAEGREVVELYGVKSWRPEASVWALEPQGIVVPREEVMVI